MKGIKIKAKSILCSTMKFFDEFFLQIIGRWVREEKGGGGEKVIWWFLINVLFYFWTEREVRKWCLTECVDGLWFKYWKLSWTAWKYSSQYWADENIFEGENNFDRYKEKRLKRKLEAWIINNQKNWKNWALTRQKLEKRLFKNEEKY